MAYTISDYSKKQARNLGVIIKPSKSKGKKIDVFNKKGDKLASIGAVGYKDYPTYLRLESSGKVPKGTASSKRRAYKARHVFRNRKGTPAYYADKILW